MNGSPRSTRRRVLLTGGAAAVAGVAGCAGVIGNSRGRSRTVQILAAGSLQNALTEGLKPAVDVPVEIETHGSATVVRLIEEGKRDPDIVAVADVALFDGPLSPSWHAEFTSNAVVVAYDPGTPGGRRIADAGPGRWYEPMVEGAVSIGRTDPDQDPLGYRTLFALELASRYYDGATNLGERLLDRDQIYPETALLSQFETGSIEAAFAYRNMAVERDYEYVELPDQIDLSNPQYARDWYETTTYMLPNGREIRGGLVSYGATVRHLSDAAVTVFDALTTGQYLADHGFLMRKQFPSYVGDVPAQVRDASEASAGNRSRIDNPDRDGATTTSDGTVLI